MIHLTIKHTNCSRNTRGCTGKKKKILRVRKRAICMQLEGRQVCPSLTFHLYFLLILTFKSWDGRDKNCVRDLGTRLFSLDVQRRRQMTSKRAFLSWLAPSPLLFLRKWDITQSSCFFKAHPWKRCEFNCLYMLIWLAYRQTGPLSKIFRWWQHDSVHGVGVQLSLSLPMLLMACLLMRSSAHQSSNCSIGHAAPNGAPQQMWAPARGSCL